jgi:hypothetical protein
MVIEHGEPADRDRKDFGKFPEPVVDPDLTVVWPFPEQERPPYATRDAVVPPRRRRINQMDTRNRHCGSPGAAQLIEAMHAI